MEIAKTRFEATGKRLIGQQHVELHRCFGNADAMALGRYGGMQVSQRVGIIEPHHFRHETFDQVQHPVGAVDKTFQQFLRIDAGAFAALVKPAFHARGFFGRRKPEEGEIIAALIKKAAFLELLPALHVQQGRCGLGKQACRIFGCRIALRFHEHRPSGAETT
ncbi:hypothetical protein D3C87_1154770 [compost metagenome]